MFARKENYAYIAIVRESMNISLLLTKTDRFGDRVLFFDLQKIVDKCISTWKLALNQIQ